MNNNLIIENMYFADCLAAKFKRKINSINYDELQSAAYFGLVQAANSFKLDSGIRFKSFAHFRIIGAIRDYLREINWGSRRRPVIMQQLES